MASKSAGVFAGHLARAQAVRASWFEYELPPTKIALRPVKDRSSSRLLVVRNASGPAGSTTSCSHHQFRELPEFLARDSLLVLNNSQVMPARIPMRKATGARAEILLLSPFADTDPTLALENSIEDSKPWKCIIGGRRVRPGDTLVHDAGSLVLRARVLSRDGTAAVVSFETETPGLSMAAAIHALGQVPLPPYIRRPADEDDTRAYQTVFAKSAGSVAAPTAGLHMTEDVMSTLRARGVHIASVTLHVGAGTFAQLGGSRTGDHHMHAERFAVSVDTLRQVAESAQGLRKLTALGTTSVRTIESLYWHGVKLLLGRNELKERDFSLDCQVDQWEPYVMMDDIGIDGLPSAHEAITKIIQTAEDRGRDGVEGLTRLLIVPGYDFKVYVPGPIDSMSPIDSMR